jgi:hypothetical protein
MAIKEFDDFFEKLRQHDELKTQMIQEMQDWSKENSSIIKKQYPQVGKLYKLDVKDLDYMDRKNIRLFRFQNLHYFKNFDIDKSIHYNKGHTVFFFRPTRTTFAPNNIFNPKCSSPDYPTVEGRVYFHNMSPYTEALIFNPLKDTFKVSVNLLSEEVEEVKKVKASTTEVESKETRVYVMIDKNTGFYKIGRSKNPKARERTLQSEKPTIEMLFNYPGLNIDEKELHNIFIEKRVRGEWFDLNGTDIQMIKEYFESK